VHGRSFEHDDLAFVHELSTRENKEPRNDQARNSTAMQGPVVVSNDTGGVHNYHLDHLTATRRARFASP
jgi:hypothetical protein